MSVTQMSMCATASIPGSTYTITAGTKAPVLGAGAQSPFPASGWTSIITVSADDANSLVNLPFNITFNGTSYSAFYPGSNFYITFGAGSNVYSSLSAANPALNKIHMAGSDNSWQRTSYTSSGTTYLRYRQEGTASTSGTPGSPNMVYEVTFFNPTLTGNEVWIELLIGQQSRTSGISGIYSSSALLTGGTMVPANAVVAANQSYVLKGNSTGTSWTVYTGYYVGGSGY